MTRKQELILIQYALKSLINGLAHKTTPKTISQSSPHAWTLAHRRKFMATMAKKFGKKVG